MSNFKQLFKQLKIENEKLKIICNSVQFLIFPRGFGAGHFPPKFRGEKFSIAFTLALFLFLPYQISIGCGPSSQYQFEGYTFINPQIINQDATYARYLLHFNDLYDSYDTLQVIQQDENIREWSERFCGWYEEKDIKKVVYEATINDMKRLRNGVSDKKATMPNRLNNNDFADHLRDEKCTEVIDYLIYAKQCERHVIVGDDWSTPSRDILEMQKMIERGKRAFYKTASHYVRLRYAYQIIRLAHYAKAYPSVLKLHDELMAKVHAHPSLIDYWIMGHRAGALLKLGKRVEADYLYSLIFANCLSKRQSAFKSFSIKNNQEWDELMLMCKSDDERAVIYTIRANASDSRAVEEMQKIYELDPRNENLELLLVKEIYKLEKDLLGTSFNDHRQRNQRYFNIPRKNAAQYLLRVRAFVEKCVNEKKVAELDLWKMAQGYLTFLSGDFYQANKTFAKIEKSLDDSKKELKEQLAVAQLALKIADLNERMDEEDENEVGNIIRNSEWYWKYKDFPDYVNDKLKSVYEKSGQKGKAFRVHYTLDALKMNPDIEIIEDLLLICDKKNKSNLEKALVKKDNVSTIKNDLLLIKGIVFFNDDKIEAALETFRKIPRNDRDAQVKFNPFHEHWIDCLGCPIGDTLLYDRVGILEEILNLEFKGRAHLETGASSFYQLGNAYYNMTYFGDSWNVNDLFRSGINWSYVNPQNKYFTLTSELGNVEYMDLSKARRYYETALELARNPELAARACFMLAKCDLNEFYIDPDTDYHPHENEIPILPEKYNTYYLKLKEEYNDTEFYREILQECQFLRG
ncbi:MAG: hypothetical protein AAF573_13685 [Bacteroidota bacterium]